jgi:hypothetical protein
MSDYSNITDAPFWSNLDFDSEIDDEMLLIEIYCSVIASTKNRFTRDTIVGMADYIDDEWEGAEDYKNQLLEPGSNFVHPSIVQRNKVFEDFDSLSVKYGEEHFTNFIQTFYDTYPKAEYSTPIEYLDSLNANNVFHIKWASIYDMLFFIQEYLKK